jgi:branched-chain amino acid transport system permease protein
MNTLTSPLAPAARSALRWRVPLLPEAFIALVAVGAYWLFPNDVGFLSNMVVMCVLALSLNLVLGQAGIASMGQAALYGAGAYAAGLFALHVSPSPLLGLGVGVLAGALVAALSGAVLLRAHGLTLVMLTIATAQLLLELVNWQRRLTGGDDGLSGFSIDPLFGVFEFDFMGHTGFFYALVVLLLAHAGLRALVQSPFGLTTRAVRLDAGRVESLGGRVYAQLLTVYVVGGAVAGAAGAVTAQTTKVASLSMLDFHLSAGVLIMVVLGGTRRLTGALLGTVGYMLIHHIAYGLNPHHWLLAIGVLLVLVMLVLPGGLLDLWDRLASLVRNRTGARHGE